MSKASLTLTDHFRKGGWLPASDKALEKWLKKLIKEVQPSLHNRAQMVLLPVVQEFLDFIENNGDMYMGFHQMFEGATHIKDYKTLVLLFNKILQQAPYYGDIGPPIYMIMHEVMNTQGGFTTLLSSKLNEQFKKMFDFWALFLDSTASCEVLHDGPNGWFSPEALKAMDEHFQLGFANTFVCDPSAPHYGFTSWDNFFNRTFQPGVRAVEFPDNPNLINAGCESRLYNIARNVNEFDQFWIKGEPYSLSHMLNHDVDYADQFIGGTIFQGFLEVVGYHRWHSPITGTVKKIVQVPGTYFVQSPAV